MKHLRSWRRRRILAFLMVGLAGILTVGTVAARSPIFTFDMVRSSAAAAAKCLPDATAQVRIRELGAVEVLTLKVEHLAPNLGYSFFVLQAPDAPFGIGWYNGEIETNAAGTGHQMFIGRFNDETFALAPGSVAAPVVHTEQPFPDASTNPAFGPVHTFHLGLWFSDPEEAKEAGCTDAVTPFDGDHIAGIQVLSTRNFPAEAGPLLEVSP